MKLSRSDAAVARLAEAGFDPLFGARPLKRAIQQQIENPVARAILEGRFGPNETIDAAYEDGQFTFHSVPTESGHAHEELAGAV
jgi:ATP-dependent Clp protease ATP-binding subunit ClpB